MSTGIDYLDETWSPVPGYARYFASNLGRIKGTPDPNPENNKLENLKWGTRVEQRADEISRGLKMGENSGTHKLTENDVLEIRKLRPFSTARELAKRYGVSHTTILAAANGEHWRHI
jgi:hypothetical protein